MQARWWWPGFLLGLILLLGGLGQASPYAPEPAVEAVEASATADAPVEIPPTIPPARPEVLPAGLSIGGLPVGGLSVEEARAALEKHILTPLYRPLPLLLDGETCLLEPAAIGLRADVDRALAQAAERISGPSPSGEIYLLLGQEGREIPVWEDIPLPVQVNERELGLQLQLLARRYDRRALPERPFTLTDTAGLEAMGVRTPAWSPERDVVAFQSPCAGRRLDVEAALPRVEDALKAGEREPLVLPVEEVPAPPANLSLLQEVLREQVAGMPGVVGIYVRDLRSGQETGVHEGVVFSGASVIKIAILLQAYQVLDAPPRGAVAQDLWAMMVYSDNAAADRLLALGGGGDGIRGARRMSEMLHRLGLEDTFMKDTYGWAEPAGRLAKGRSSGRATPRGQAPVTDPDPLLQTTPRDMGRLLAYIYECTRGKGPLLETFPEEVTAEECREMVDLMLQNADRERLVAGIPEGIPVAHKSGWIPDMKADAGIVFSPGGDYVVSIFVWEEGNLTDSEGNPRIAALSWIVYAFFNPF
ncbi:MAG: serine hydrolase [Chloroflexia bacterium]